MPRPKLSVERRSDHRALVKIPVKFRPVDDDKVLQDIEEWRNTRQNGYTLDVSCSGMQLAVDRPLKQGSVLKFDLYLLDQVTIVGVFARVVWSRGGEAGLHFLMMKPKCLEALKHFLAKAPRDHFGPKT